MRRVHGYWLFKSLGTAAVDCRWRRYFHAVAADSGCVSPVVMLATVTGSCVCVYARSKHLAASPADGPTIDALARRATVHSALVRRVRTSCARAAVRSFGESSPVFVWPRCSRDFDLLNDAAWLLCFVRRSVPLLGACVKPSSNYRVILPPPPRRRQIWDTGARVPLDFQQLNSFGRPFVNGSPYAIGPLSVLSVCSVL